MFISDYPALGLRPRSVQKSSHDLVKKFRICSPPQVIDLVSEEWNPEEDCVLSASTPAFFAGLQGTIHTEKNKLGLSPDRVSFTEVSV